jgi:hypothetical protein
MSKAYRYKAQSVGLSAQMQKKRAQIAHARADWLRYRRHSSGAAHWYEAAAAIKQMADMQLGAT